MVRALRGSRLDGAGGKPRRVRNRSIDMLLRNVGFTRAESRKHIPGLEGETFFPENGFDRVLGMAGRGEAMNAILKLKLAHR